MVLFHRIMISWSASCHTRLIDHFDLIKSVAQYTNNKEVILCIQVLRYYCRGGLVQPYEQVLEDPLDSNDSKSCPIAMEQYETEGH